ncbi:MAG: hypothetical protein OEZ16_06115 [Chromatiales bacterium]|nr:hypothetical protein [Chromatiales bacterium]
MKKTTLIVPLLASLIAAPAIAGHGHGHERGHHKGKHHRHDSVVVMARVVRVQPIIDVVQLPQQRRECWNEQVTGTATHHSNDGMLVGAILGGVIGHNIGHGSQRDVTRTAGTIIGATIGHQNDRHYQQPVTYTEQRCSQHTDYVSEEQIRGYRVTYHYQGERYTTRMDHDPGSHVQIRVSHRLLD